MTMGNSIHSFDTNLRRYVLDTRSAPRRWKSVWEISSDVWNLRNRRYDMWDWVVHDSRKQQPWRSQVSRRWSKMLRYRNPSANSKRKLRLWHVVSANLRTGACSGLDAINSYPVLPRSSTLSSPNYVWIAPWFWRNNLARVFPLFTASLCGGAPGGISG